jgi:hypothetical protein
VVSSLLSGHSAGPATYPSNADGQAEHRDREARRPKTWMRNEGDVAVEVERTGAMTHSPRNPQQAVTSAERALRQITLGSRSL